MIFLPSDEFVQEFIPNFSILELSDTEQKVILQTLERFKKFKENFLSRGFRHYVMPEYTKLTDLPTFAHLRKQKTFNGRLWDEVRGIGGCDAATGIEAIRNIAKGGYNAFAHELAHQLHQILPNGFRNPTVLRLYYRAIENGLVLDDYAAANVMEYFAQGVEAFFSIEKNEESQKQKYHCHIRRELRQRDKALFKYLERLFQ
jgi:alpha-glucosidase